MDQPDFGKKIIHLRKGLNLTQEELASKSSLGLRTIQRIETGRVRPRTSTISLLLASLEITEQDFKDLKLKYSFKDWIAYFLLEEEKSKVVLLKSIRMAWVAGIFYFFMLLIEHAVEYLLLLEGKINGYFSILYVVVKILVLLSFSIFFRGFFVVSKITDKPLLRISSLFMIGALSGIVFSDLIKLIYINDEMIKLGLTVIQSVIMGSTGIFFGISLQNLNLNISSISRWAGIIEIMMGVFFITVFLSPLALFLMLPVTILEVMLLYGVWGMIRCDY